MQRSLCLESASIIVLNSGQLTIHDYQSSKKTAAKIFVEGQTQQAPQKRKYVYHRYNNLNRSEEAFFSKTLVKSRFKVLFSRQVKQTKRCQTPCQCKSPLPMQSASCQPNRSTKLRKKNTIMRAALTAQMHGRNCSAVSTWSRKLRRRQLWTYVHDNQHWNVKHVSLNGPTIGTVYLPIYGRPCNAIAAIDPPDTVSKRAKRS